MNKNLKLILSLISIACSIGTLVITILKLRQHKKEYIEIGKEFYME